MFFRHRFRPQFYFHQWNTYNLHLFYSQANNKGIHGPVESRPVATVQYKASEHPRAEHPAPPDALLANHARIRQSGHSCSTDGNAELHQRVAQIHRQELPFAQFSCNARQLAHRNQEGTRRQKIVLQPTFRKNKKLSKNICQYKPPPSICVYYNSANVCMYIERTPQHGMG